MDKESLVLTKARIILAVEDGKTDEELYKLSEGFGDNRKDGLMNTIINSKLDHKVRFLADFMTTKFPDDARSLLMKATQMSGNWDSKAQYEELIARYEELHGVDYDLLIEKLHHCLKYEVENIDKIRTLMNEVDAINEAEVE